MFKFSKRSLERLEGVDPKLLKVLFLALEMSPIDIGVPEYGGVRTLEDQQKLYAQGRDSKGKVIGKTITKADGVLQKSAHQSGRAVDFYAYVQGSASWDPVHLALFAGVMYAAAKQLEVEIIWGGSFGSSKWKGWDAAHFQLK